MATPPTVTAACFDAVLDWSQPMLTFYDDTTAERTELSAATLGNWAAKTGNFLVDELGVAPGDVIVVDLPQHWQTAAILLGCWWTGAQVRPAGPGVTDDDAVAVFTAAARIDDHPDAAELVVASLDPFAMPVPGLPPGVTDFATAVRVHGDQFRPPHTSPDDPALDDRSVAEVLSAATQAAENDGISAGARVLSTRGWDDADALITDLIGVLAAGASLITVANVDPDSVERKAVTEKASVRVLTIR